MLRPMSLLLVLVLLIAPVAAHGGGGGHESIEDRVYEASGSISPGDFAEVDFEAEAGDVIEWSVEATSEVNVNLHEHVMETVYHVRENSTRTASGSFSVPHNGTFSLMIVGIQGGDPADVEVVLDGRLAVVGSQRLSETGEASGPLALLVPAAFLGAFAMSRRRH